MIDINVTVRGLTQLQRSLNLERLKSVKALDTAVKVEGYRLRKKLQEEIRSGAPGGRSFAPLSFIARHLNRSRRALSKLAAPIRYFIPKDSPIEMHVGWTGPGVSKSWQRIAQRQQEGFTSTVSERQRRYFKLVGASMKGRWSKAGRSGGQVMSQHKDAKYFFLSKSTVQMRTPARPIMDPFWSANRQEAWRNIRRNTLAKMRGQRI